MFSVGTPGGIPPRQELPDEREQLKLEYEKAKLRVERAKTLIELHQGGVAEDGEGESEKDQPAEPKKASSGGD